MPQVPKVSVVVLTWNGKEDTLECLNSLQKVDYANFDVVVVDNASADDSVEVIQSAFPAATLLQNRENLGYTGGNNVGIRHAMGNGSDYVFVLNNDTLVDRNLLAPLVAKMEAEPDLAVAGSRIYYCDQPTVIQSAGGRISPETGRVRHLGEGEVDEGQTWPESEYNFVTGSGMLLRSRALREVGLLDPAFFVYFEESDLCLRCQEHGYRVVSVSESKVWHKDATSFGGWGSPRQLYLLVRNKIRFTRKRGFPLTWARFAAYHVRPNLPHYLKLLRTGRLEAGSAMLMGLLDGRLGRYGRPSDGDWFPARHELLHRWFANFLSVIELSSSYARKAIQATVVWRSSGPYSPPRTAAALGRTSPGRARSGYRSSPPSGVPQSVSSMRWTLPGRRLIASPSFAVDRPARPALKIALFHNLPSGGAKRALYDLTRVLRDDGHEFGLFSLTTANEDYLPLRPLCEFGERLRLDYPPPLPWLAGRRYAPLNLLRKWVSVRRQKEAVREIDSLCARLADDIRERAYDVAFVHSCRYVGAPFLLRHLRRVGVPSVYYCHEPMRTLYEPEATPQAPGSDGPVGLARLREASPLLAAAIDRSRLSYLVDIDRSNFLCGHLVLCNSHYTREYVHRVYGLLARVCYLGIDVERFRPLGLPREDFVLSIGRLDPRKGHELVIDALSRLPDRERPPLRIVGDQGSGKAAGRLETLAKDKGVKVHVCVDVTDEELVTLYNQARFVAYAPIMEPFGLVPLEAMACGTPVAAVREAGIRETVLHGEVGLLSERDADEFAGAMAALSSPRTAEGMGRHAVSYVRERWSLRAAADRLVAHLGQAAGLHE